MLLINRLTQPGLIKRIELRPNVIMIELETKERMVFTRSMVVMSDNAEVEKRHQYIKEVMKSGNTAEAP